MCHLHLPFSVPVTPSSKHIFQRPGSSLQLQGKRDKGDISKGKMERLTEIVLKQSSPPLRLITGVFKDQ